MSRSFKAKDLTQLFESLSELGFEPKGDFDVSKAIEEFETKMNSVRIDVKNKDLSMSVSGRIYAGAPSFEVVVNGHTRKPKGTRTETTDALVQRVIRAVKTRKQQIAEHDHAEHERQLELAVTSDVVTQVFGDAVSSDGIHILINYKGFVFRVYTHESPEDAYVNLRVNQLAYSNYTNRGINKDLNMVQLKALVDAMVDIGIEPEYTE